MMGAGGASDVLLENDAASLATAEAEAERDHLGPWITQEDRVFLDVVGVEARDGEHLEVLDGGGLVLDEAAQGGVGPLEGPRYEGREAAGFLDCSGGPT